MAPVEQPKAKRRWTPNRSREGREESSNEDYGEEILPTIDLDALATLSRDDQEKFKEMRRRDRKNVIARWRREGRPLPETSASSSSGSSKPIARKSSAPQLPELQMDVEPKGTFSSASDNARQPTRFHGIGPIPPESGLASHAPSASERMHGQTVTSVHNVLRSTGQLNAHNAAALARQAANPIQSEDPGQQEYLETRSDFFIRPSRSVGQDIAPVRAWRTEARAQGMELSPPTTADSEGRDMPNLTAVRDEGLKQIMKKAKRSPMKRAAKVIGAGIKSLFKGKVDKGQPAAPGRPASRLRFHDEARTGTATAVTITSVRAPQPSRYFSRDPPPLQAATVVPDARTGSPRRHTTRARMENYD